MILAAIPHYATAYPDLVYVETGTFVSGSTAQIGAAELSSTFSYEGYGSYAYASLSDGVLRASASSSTDNTLYVSQAVAGLQTRIHLEGTESPGEVSITMWVTGTASVPAESLWGFQVYALSGGGMPEAWIPQSVRGRTVPSNDMDNLGTFALSANSYESLSHYQSSAGCSNCSYTAGQLFPIASTAMFPFEAGADYLDYKADLFLSALNGASFDATNTAVFSIVVPDGVTYDSALHFVALQDDPTPVPAPPTLALVMIALMAAMVASGRRRIGSGWAGRTGRRGRELIQAFA